MENKVNGRARIRLRLLEVKDLDDYLYWNHPSREFHKYNGPYFKKRTEAELEQFVEDVRVRLQNGEVDGLNLHHCRMIVDCADDTLVGQVNWYWKSEETNWMEIGVVIFNEQYWGTGLGFEALALWVDELFALHPELVRLGLTTWSGNERMMKLAEKLGFKKEAVYRKARIVEGEYFDSVSYGILKEEWLAFKAAQAAG